MLAWFGVVVGVLLAAGLIVLVVVADLDTAGQVAGIVGTIVGLAALGVSVYALRQPGSQGAAGPTVTSGGVRSVAVGGGVSGTVSTGDRHTSVQVPGRRRAAGPPPTAPPPGASGTVHASGERSVATGGEISGDVSTGDGER